MSLSALSKSSARRGKLKLRPRQIGAVLSAIALLTLPLPARAAQGALVRLTPSWSFENGWEITAWAGDSSADRVLAVRGTERITMPQPGWAVRDLVLLDGRGGAEAVYGPESGVGADPIHRATPRLTPSGAAGVFATYRRAYPQGSDLRLWEEGAGQQVVFQSGQNFDLDFPALDADGRGGVVVEIMPLTADNHVFRMRVHRWSVDGPPTMLVEHQNRHITGLDMSDDGARVVYCLQNFSEKPDSGEIRLLNRDGSGSTVFSFLGVGGPVAMSADGKVVAAFLPGTPAELGDPTADDPGVYLWRDGGEIVRIDESGAVADSRVPLSMSADGRRVSWRGYLWEEGAGVSRALVDEAAPGDSGALMSADGSNWTIWLPAGPSGQGLYRQRQSETYRLNLPLLVNF